MLAWYVSEETLRALTMVMPSMPYSSIRRSDGEASTVKLTTASVSVFRGFIHYLVKGGVDIVCKLDLSYWGVARSCCSNSKSNNALQQKVSSLQWRCMSHNIDFTLYLLRQRGIEDSVFAKTLQQPSCTSEHSTKADVLPKHQSPVVYVSIKQQEKQPAHPI